MPYYEIINPSDPYTLRAPDLATAVVAALLLGDGRYGLLDEAGNQAMPIFLLTGLDEWLQAQFGCDPNGLLERIGYVALAECFESVAICPLHERPLWDKRVAALPESERAEWLANWHDKHRTSLNDIGGRAMKYAQQLRAKAQPA